MAASFLASHGIDLQAELTHAQFPPLHTPLGNESTKRLRHIALIPSVRIPYQPSSTLCDISLRDIYSIDISNDPLSILSSARECFVAPSLCHPHIHIDKAFIFSEPRYDDLEMETGEFEEAMRLTRDAKARFTREDMWRRMDWCVTESVRAGVGAMRAFVEVDRGIGSKGLEMALEIKKAWEERCDLQICAFAQEAVFSGEDGGDGNRNLMEEAVGVKGVEAVGSTPYVEANMEGMRKNIEWVIEIALKEGKHVDLHLDYNLDESKEALVWYVIETLKSKDWMHRAGAGKTVVLGHCTRLTLFSHGEWQRLRNEVGDLPVHFVGLPTSDIFMATEPRARDDGCIPRVRGTLQIPWMIDQFGFNGAIGVNNVGNAFTPQGSCDPLSVACLGVGLYQAGTVKDAEVLYECVSSRAKAAIGYHSPPMDVRQGSNGDLTIFGMPLEKQTKHYRRRRTLKEIVYDAGSDRMLIKNGRLVTE